MNDELKFIALRIVEEASEVIKEYAKAERFGWDSYHPRDPDKVSNSDRLRSEISDLEAQTRKFHDLSGCC